MTQYVLENDVLFGGAVLRAGKVIDDAAFNIAAIEATGAILIPADPVSLGLADQLLALRSQGRNWSIDPGVPISTNLKSIGSTTFLTQPEWFVDSLAIGNSGNGKFENTPIKTFGEWQRRVGRNSVLSPIGGLLVINVMNLLPDNDPIEWHNAMAPGCTAIVTGQKVIRLSEATITGVDDKDTAANIPWTITAAALVGGWKQYLRLYVEITSGPATGARGIVARALSGTKAHITEWCSPNPDTDGFVVPSDFVPEIGRAHV